MPPVEIVSVLLAVAVMHWVNLVLPGPNVLLIARLAADGQRPVALAVGLGMSTMVLAWTLLAATGLSATLGAPGPMQTALQVAGGSWLCLLACRLWRRDQRAAASAASAASASPAASTAALHPAPAAPDRPADGDHAIEPLFGVAPIGALRRLTRAFGLGLATSAANPAALLFPLAIFVAVVPREVEPTLNGLVTLVLFLDATAWYSMVALTLSRPGVCALYLRHRTLLSRASSTLIALMGARMIVLALPAT